MTSELQRSEDHRLTPQLVRLNKASWLIDPSRDRASPQRLPRRQPATGGGHGSLTRDSLAVRSHTSGSECDLG